MGYVVGMETNKTADPTKDPRYQAGHFAGLNRLRVSSREYVWLEGYEDGLMEREGYA